MTIEKGYICDCCLKEIPVHQYKAHRRACFSEHCQRINTKIMSNLKMFENTFGIEKKFFRFNDLTLTGAIK